MVERKRHNTLCNQLVNTLLHNSYSKYVVYYTQASEWHKKLVHQKIN